MEQQDRKEPPDPVTILNHLKRPKFKHKVETFGISREDLIRALRGRLDESLSREGADISLILTLIKRLLVINSLPENFLTLDEKYKREFIFELYPRLQNFSDDRLDEAFPAGNRTQLERVHKVILQLREKIETDCTLTQAILCAQGNDREQVLTEKEIKDLWVNKAGGGLSSREGGVISSICHQLDQEGNEKQQLVKKRFCTLFRLFVLRKLPGAYTPFIIPDRNLEHGEFMRQLEMNNLLPSDKERGEKKLESRCSAVGIPSHCDDSRISTLASLMPHQMFVTRYFTVMNPFKGLLVWHSLGSGKTCTIISAATSTFLLDGWLIIWVTRGSLKTDIYKNMYKTICHLLYRQLKKEGGYKIPLPTDKEGLASFKRKWSKLFDRRFLEPVSYKVFETFVSKKWPSENELKNFRPDSGTTLFHKVARFQKEREGPYTKLDDGHTIDMLSNVLVIVDEAHRLLAGRGEAAALDESERVQPKGLEKMKERFSQSDKSSGVDSCKRVFLTASPICGHPVELFRILNFLIDGSNDKPFPEDEDTFNREWLDASGSVRPDKANELRQRAKGLISYLDKSQDATLFPIIHRIYNVPNGHLPH